MHDFLSALAPEPFQVLGVELKPLSYGHVVLLSRLDMDPVRTVPELFAATEICRRDFQGGLDYIREFMTPIGQAKLEVVVQKSKERDIRQAFAAWHAYLEANSSRPEYCETEGVSSDRGAPFLAQLREVLLGLNYTPQYLMNAPYGQCLWDYGCVIEAANGWGIVGDQHREIARLLEARN